MSLSCEPVIQLTRKGPYMRTIADTSTLNTPPKTHKRAAWPDQAILCSEKPVTVRPIVISPSSICDRTCSTSRPWRICSKTFTYSGCACSSSRNSSSTSSLSLFLLDPSTLSELANELKTRACRRPVRRVADRRGAPCGRPDVRGQVASDAPVRGLVVDARHQSSPHNRDNVRLARTQENRIRPDATDDGRHDKWCNFHDRACGQPSHVDQKQSTHLPTGYRRAKRFQGI